MKKHKENNPLRPIINWTNAPAYTFAKHLVRVLEFYIPFSHAYNVKIIINILSNLRDTEFHEKITLTSLIIKNMYTNIPTNKLKNIIGSMLDQHHINDITKQEILKYSIIILDKNFFQCSDRQYKESSCLAMGAPTSSIFSEVYLQYMECTSFVDILNQQKILGLFHYVGDIPIIYGKTAADIDNIIETFNSIHPTLTFSKEDETDNSLSFLDVTLRRTENNFTVTLCRIPTGIVFLLFLCIYLASFI